MEIDPQILEELKDKEHFSRTDILRILLLINKELEQPFPDISRCRELIRMVTKKI